MDVLQLLNDNTVLIVNDWAMKFLSQLYRESQQDWFGKRGISWHISVVFRRKSGELQSQAFIHIGQSCIQDSTAVILACQTMEQSTGIKVVRLDFSDPQGGKGAADRLAATCKYHIRIYLNEGHDVTTAEEMREALLSHRGVEGVRVALLPSINQTVELQKIPGINKLNNFQLTDGFLQAWRAYGIGPGKSIAKEKVSGQCHLITNVSF